MDKLDVILLMSVNPGFGGQSFIPGTLDKLRQVRRLIDESGATFASRSTAGSRSTTFAKLPRLAPTCSWPARPSSVARTTRR